MKRDRLTVEVVERFNESGWLSALIEDDTGNLLANVTAPVVEGATFDTRAAVIRAAVEEALADQPKGEGR